VNVENIPNGKKLSLCLIKACVGRGDMFRACQTSVEGKGCSLSGIHFVAVWMGSRNEEVWENQVRDERNNLRNFRAGQNGLIPCMKKRKRVK
jgi:hypothetical protein